MYTTAAEAGAYNVPIYVDGVQCYLSTFPLGDRRGTICYVRFTDGAVRTIGVDRQPDYSGKLSYGEGTHTFTVPAGCVKMKVTCCGGGGGAVCIRDTEYDGIGSRDNITDEFNYMCGVFLNHPEGVSAGNGGDTYLDNGAVMARGGNGGFFHRGAQRSDDTWYIDYNGSSVGGYPNGRNGVVSGSIGSGTVDSGYPATGFSVENYIVNGDFGRGGRYFVSNWGDTWTTRWYGTGGSGGWNQGLIDVTPGQVITLHVGSGGTGRICDCWGRHHDVRDGDDIWAENGNGGFIILEYGGSIT